MNLHWRIEMLGGLRVFGNGQSPVKLQTRRIAGLLVTLAFRPDVMQSRETLAESLWTESPPETARLSLRVALSALRKILEPELEFAGKALTATRTHITLNSAAFSSDVVEFKSLCKLAIKAASPEDRTLRIEQALALYQGEFLPGFYEDWILAEREALIEQCYEALTLYAEAAMTTGATEKSLAIARRATVLLPLRETAHELLIRRYFELGKIQQGLNHYSLYAELLKNELNASPSREVRSLVLHYAANFPEVNLQNTRASIEKKSLSEEVFLPRPLTRFFGREKELEILIPMLTGVGESIAGSERLISIAGMGGVGKSRLSIETALLVSSEFEITAFVPLADAREVESIRRKIADSMRLKLSPKVSLEVQIRQRLISKRTLLVLDNFDSLLDFSETVREETIHFIRETLSDLPSLHLLISTRRALNISGERILILKPLELPPPSLPVDLSREFPAVRIFLDRAFAVGADCSDEKSLFNAIKICAKLEGIPLAIELAAAWASVLSTDRMLDHLEKSYEFPSSRNVDLPDRHRTLSSALESSFSLLNPALLDFMLSLSLFSGGWTAEAAESVARGPEVLSLLAELKERSLINSNLRSGTVRFDMLERVREFCKLKLDSRAEAEFRNRHLLFYAILLEESISLESKTFDPETLHRMEEEMGNLRLAMKTAQSEMSDPLVSLRLAATLGPYCEMQGHLQEGAIFLEKTLARTSTQCDSLLRAKALSALGRCLFQLGEYEGAKKEFSISLQLFRKFGDLDGEAKALGNLSITAEIQGDYEAAVEMNLESLAIRRSQKDRIGEAGALNNLGVIALQRERLEEAKSCFQSSLSIKYEIGEKRAIANTLTNLGNIAHKQGEFTSANALHEETLRLRRELNDRQGVAWSLNNLGIVSISQLDFARARSLFEESLEIKRQLGDKLGIAQSLKNLGKIEFEENRSDRAYELFYEAYTLFRAIGNLHGVESSLESLRSVSQKEAN